MDAFGFQTKPAADVDTVPHQLPPSLKAGDEWLSPAERQHVRCINARRQLFSGKHREHFYRDGNTQHRFKAIGPNMFRVLYLVDNLPGMCTLKLVDFLFGEELAVSPDSTAQDPEALGAAIARFSESAKLHPLLYKAAAAAGWNGKAYWQLRVVKGQVTAELIEPECIFPAYFPGSTTLMSAAVKMRVSVNGVNYCRVDTHTVGQITHELFELDDKDKVVKAASASLIGLSDVEQTKIDELTIVEIVNYTPGGEGHSDYDGTETIIDEINNRLTQISRILDQHGDPVIVALEKLFDEAGNLRVSGGKAVAAESLEKGDPLRYVTWEANLEYQCKQLVDARYAFLRQQEVAPSLVGMETGSSSADTWKKFKLTISGTLARVKRKKLFMSPSIKGLFRVAFKLENAWSLIPVYPVGAVALTFSDGLPADETELQQIICGYRNTTDGKPLLSRHMALTWMHGDPKIVAEEEERLDEEADESAPAMLRGASLEQANETGGPGNPTGEDMAECPDCGSEADSGAKFCPECGGKMPGDKTRPSGAEGA